MQFRRLLFSLCLILSVCACSIGVKYSTFLPVGSDRWNLSDTLEFNTDTLRQRGRYAFKCDIRVNRDYPYLNLVMIVERNVIRDSLKVMQKMEKLTIPVFETHGKIKGEGVALKQISSNLSDFILEKGDSLNIRVYHQMSLNTLPGVVDVGITMTER